MPVPLDVIRIFHDPIDLPDVVVTDGEDAFLANSTCQSTGAAVWSRLADLAAQGFVAIPAEPNVPQETSSKSADGWPEAAIGATSACKSCGILRDRGKNQTLCQLDTGFTPNRFFENSSRRIILDPAQNFVERDGSPPDDPGFGGGIVAKIVGLHNHGTGAASVAVASLSDRFSGIAPAADFIPMRVSPGTVVFAGHRLGFLAGNDEERFAVALQAVARMADIKSTAPGQCDVVSIAQGGPLPYRPLWTGLVEAIRSGAIIVSAAGQVPKIPLASIIRMRPAFPARYSATGIPIVAVGGIKPSGDPWPSAFRGEAVDISAPATHISRVVFEKNPENGLKEAKIDDSGEGTTFATNFTAAAALLWLQKWGGRRNVFAHYKTTELSAAAIPCAFRLSVRRSARDDGKRLWQQGFGHGVLDIGRLLALPLPPASSVRECVTRFETTARTQARVLHYSSNALEGWELEDQSHDARSVSVAADRGSENAIESIRLHDEVTAAESLLAAEELARLVDDSALSGAARRKELCQDLVAFKKGSGVGNTASANLRKRMSDSDFISSARRSNCEVRQ